MTGDVGRLGDHRPVVSVVVPCYEVEAYVDECLSSVVRQSYPHLQIVVVDDGSNDRTPELVRAWAGRDPRIEVVRQENAGLGAARNLGIDRATGDYLTFVDSDDLLEPTAIERMVAAIETSNSDFVTGVVDRFDSSRRWRLVLHRRGFNENLRRTHVYERPSLLNDHFACAKLFRRSFWDRHGCRFPTGVLFEDIELITRTHCLAEAVDIEAKPVYLWRVREGEDLSITQRRTAPGSVSARFDALCAVDRFLELEAPPNVWRRHGMKVFRLDMLLYLREFSGGGAAYQTEFLDGARRFSERMSPDAVDSLPPNKRLLRQRILEGDRRSVAGLAVLTDDKRTRLRALRALSAVGWADRRSLVVSGCRRRVDSVRQVLGRSRR
ncbi:MAG: glycosyltransferase family 2 protein [Actinomycetota bacterium]